MANKPIATIEVPRFITQIELSKKRKAKYYNKYANKGVNKEIPKKYSGNNFYFDKSGWLLDKRTNKRVIANPRSAGTPKTEKLSGNNLISGYGSHHVRSKIIRELKNFYRPYVQKHIKKHGPITDFPIRIEWEVHTVVNDNPNWDASNLFFYYKYFEDCLFEKTEIDNKGLKNPLYKNKELLQMIPDDNVKYITHPGSAKIIPVDDWNNRKFIFKFYKDDRPELQRQPWQ